MIHHRSSLIETLLVVATSIVIGYEAKNAVRRITGKDDIAVFNRGVAAGERRAKAAYEEKLQRFKQAMESRTADSKSYFDTVLAVITVGYAHAASCDGKVTMTKRTEVDEFVVGQSLSKLPPQLRLKLDEIASNPPDVQTAYAAVMKIAPDSMEICDMLIALLDMNPNASPATHTPGFTNVWNQLKAAA